MNLLQLMLCACAQVYELLSVSLYELLRQNKFVGLSLGRVRFCAHQILLALHTLHK